MLVFISHNKADKEAARDIGLFLAAEGISVWFDEWEVNAGDSIVGKLNDAIARCSHVLLLWSKNASQSNWVQTELSAAIHTALQAQRPRVIPMLIDDTPLPPLVAHLKYIRYGGGTEVDRSAIVKAVSGAAPTVSFIRAIVRKYHEVITEDVAGDPFGLAACPQCGNDEFKRGAFTSDRDHTFYAIECRECGWSDWTE